MFRFYNRDIQILVTLLLELKMFELVHLYNFIDSGSSSIKKSFIKIFAELLGKHVCWCPFFKKKYRLRVDKKKVSSTGVLS